MSGGTNTKTDKLLPEFISGGGEMGEKIRQFDWSKTAMGPIETWTQNLRTCVRIMLTSRQPIWIGWGRDLIKLYNDPYISIVGGKHPWALGKPASVVWKDIWKDIAPMLKSAMEKDEGTYVESQLLIMERNGYPEETYYTFSYTPIPGENGESAGIICANTDDTDRIISERQLTTLTRLANNLSDSHTDSQVIRKTIVTLDENPLDFPFALYYTLTGNLAVLSDHTYLGESSGSIPTEIDLDKNDLPAILMKKAATLLEIQVLDELNTRIGKMPKGAWQRSPDKAIIIPVIQSDGSGAYGFLVVGLNPYRLFDEKYNTFFSLVSDQVTKSLVKIYALDEERKRTEALAAIDRAKTTFFSNISHEFRTPLTLLLGPVSDALNDAAITSENRERLEIAHRNALRMQKLVNTLLDFSKIEAGRLEGRFSKIDICRFTSDLASTFRSAIEKAGMRLEIECGKIEEDVYVDMDMWEKIILNLLSNAFKYSREGTISISVTQKFHRIIVSISDNGIGIPYDQLEQIFDRFHRVEKVSGRSEEGTGIGLSLVRELVRLHSGIISVKSEPGKGSTFTVSLPAGKEHLDPGKIIMHGPENYSATNTMAFIEESLKWIPADDENNVPETTKDEMDNNSHAKGRHRVLVCDDNADMRDYVKRMLAPQFEVITAFNGQDAFDKTSKYLPDLVVSDIMMPVLNGFELLKKIRTHNHLKNIPVIFLSARAGEESKVEGLDAGADDYLVKPFSAKELLARIEGNIRIAKSRMAAEANLKNIIMQAPVAMAIFKGKDLVLEIANRSALEMWGTRKEPIMFRPHDEAFPETASEYGPLMRRVLETGEPFHAHEQPVQLYRNGNLETRYLSFVLHPLKNEEGSITGVLVAANDVTSHVLALKKIEKSQKELNEMANAMPQLVWIADAAGNVTYYNDRVAEFAGAKKLPDGNWSWEGLLHKDDLKITQDSWNNSVRTGEVYQVEHRVMLKDGTYRWYLSRGIPQKDENGNIIKWFGTATDIHVSKEHSKILEQQVQQRTLELQELNKNLQQSNDDLQQFAHVASHDLKEPLRKIKTFSGRLVEDNGSLLSERSKVYLYKMNSATDRMYSMIEGVLNYSTLNASEEQTQLVNLNEIIAQIETDLEILIQEKNAEIAYDDLPVIEGASVLVYQLFYNILNNALKFTSPDRKPEITIRSYVKSSHKGDIAEITVADNGIGFDKQQAEKIFDPFARLNSKDRYEGTGLGLALCKKIVQRHHGNITASSIINKGSVFTVSLPVKHKTPLLKQII
jgi:PAS domain S-box-containing protein